MITKAKLKFARYQVHRLTRSFMRRRERTILGNSRISTSSGAFLDELLPSVTTVKTRQSFKPLFGVRPRHETDSH